MNKFLTRIIKKLTFKIFYTKLVTWLKKRKSYSEKVSLNKENIRHFQNSHMFAWYAKINF